MGGCPTDLYITIKALISVAVTFSGLISLDRSNSPLGLAVNVIIGILWF
jgi:hypothetical protein